MKAKNLFDEQISGRPVDVFEYLCDVPSKKFLLMYFGTGELGPADGSQIAEMTHYGYQKSPNFETEWNIIAPQAQKAYGEFDLGIFDWMIKRYGEDIEIVIAGHSLGAQEVMNIINKYHGRFIVNQVVGAIPVAGRMSGPYPADFCQSYDIPITCFAGKQDTAINPNETLKFATMVNSCATRVNKVVTRIIDGYNHTTIMGYVYKPDRNAEGYQTIRNFFTWSKAIECTATLDEDNGTATFHLPEGDKTYLISPV